MEKRVAVVCGDEIRDAVVLPGTNAHDLLTQVNLPNGCFLSKRDGLPFGDTEMLYDQLRDGEKLYSSAEATVGLRGV